MGKARLFSKVALVRLTWVVGRFCAKDPANNLLARYRVGEFVRFEADRLNQ